MSIYDPNLQVPIEIVRAAVAVQSWADSHDPSGEWVLMGLTPMARIEKHVLRIQTMCKDWESLAEQIRNMQRQLAEVTAERDHYKRACERADQLRNHERGIVQPAADVEVPQVERRKVAR